MTNPANGHLYYLLSENTWAGSEAEAISLGGHLVTINDAAEQEWVVNTFVAGFGGNHLIWTGLNDVREEGSFEWASGEPLATTHWAGGEPNNANGNEHFVAMYYEGHDARGLWNDWPDVSSDPIAIPVRGVVEVKDRVLIDFEGFTGASFFAGSAIPPGSRVTSQYLDEGITFTSGAGYAAAIHLGADHAVSGLIGLSGSTEGGVVSYAFADPIVIRFFTPTNLAIRAVTDYFSVRADLLHNNGQDSYVLEAFDAFGGVLGSAEFPDGPNVIGEITWSGMHSIWIRGTGTTAFDEVVFNRVRAAKPPLFLAVNEGEAHLTWPALEPGFALEQTKDLTAPITWSSVPATPTGFGSEASVSLDEQAFFRLVPQ